MSHVFTYFMGENIVCMGEAHTTQQFNVPLQDYKFFFSFFFFSILEEILRAFTINLGTTNVPPPTGSCAVLFFFFYRMYVLHPLVLTVCVINSKYMNVFFFFRATLSMRGFWFNRIYFDFRHILDLALKNASEI